MKQANKGELREACLRVAHQVQLTGHQLHRGKTSTVAEAELFLEFVGATSTGAELRLLALRIAADGQQAKRAEELIVTAKSYAAFLKPAPAPSERRGFDTAHTAEGERV